jgi:hypothetical protein
MSEKSILRSTTDSAEYYYGRYKKAYRHDEELAVSSIKRVKQLEEAPLPQPSGHDLELARRRVRLEEAKNHQGAENIAQNAGWDYKRRPAAYYEMAVIDAYIDGVQINVEEPLVIGQRAIDPEK